MKITIACVGKLKEKYLTAAMDEYVKRLQPFCKLEIISINEEKMPLLDLQGKQITSPELAEKMDALAVQGVSHITFVIGGAFGYTDALRKKADFRWSFSKLTFTHQMIRVLLAEQIYRAFKISKGEKYHW